MSGQVDTYCLQFDEVFASESNGSLLDVFNGYNLTLQVANDGEGLLAPWPL